MRRCLSIVLALLMVSSLLVLASCAKPTDTSNSDITALKYIGDSKLKKRFESCATMQDIFDDISVIDLKQEMNISGLDKETEENEEDSTSIDYYYRNKDLIYAVYNGYGENTWEYYTTSKSGKPLIVSHWDEGNGPNVKIKTNDDSLDYQYVVYYENVSTDFGNGAERINVTVAPKEESFTYLISGNTYYISSAVYWKDDNLYYYTADAEDGKITYQYDKEVVSSNVPESNKDVIKVLNHCAGLESVNIVYGSQKIYLGKEGGFFISAGTTLVFDTEANANSAISKLKSTSVKDRDFTVEYDDGAQVYRVDVGTLVYGVSKHYENLREALIDMAIIEVDENSFRTVTLDDENDILKLDYSNVSYYFDY